MKIPILQARASALLVSLSFALCAAAKPFQAAPASPSAPKHAIGTKQRVAGIPNFGQVTPHLYRGGQPDFQEMKSLKEMGVDIVINMRGGRNKREKKTVESLGMRYISIPWHCPYPTDKPFAKFLKVIRENPRKKIFVHCRLGDDRTGMAIASYRMADDGWSADEAMKEMEAFGFDRFHHNICPGLAHYERSFPKRLVTSRAFKDLPPRSR